MGPLVGVGGLHVPGESVGDLERALAALCATAGFPEGQGFKWSPGRGHWMWKGLVDDGRQRFFIDALQLAASHGSHCIVVIEDTEHLTATAPGIDHVLDATTLFLERANTELRATRAFGLVIVDRPSGGARRMLAILVHALRLLGPARNMSNQIASRSMCCPPRLIWFDFFSSPMLSFLARFLLLPERTAIRRRSLVRSFRCSTVAG